MPASCACAQTGSKRDVAGRMPLRAARGDQQRLGAQLDAPRRPRPGALEVHQRHVGGGQQPPVDRAEVGHHAVVGAGGGVAEIDIAALVEAEVAEAEGGEDQLAGEAQQVDGAAGRSSRRKAPSAS